MGSFQKGVLRYREIGIPGDQATDNEIIYLPYTPISEDGGTGDAIKVAVGNFVWPGTNADGDLQVQGLGSGAPIGFVRRVQRYYNFDVDSNSSQEIPAGYPVEVAIRGDFFAVATTVATVGQKVFASNLDGTLATGATGATIADHTETNYTVVTAAAIASTFVMTNWGA